MPRSAARFGDIVCYRFFGTTFHDEPMMVIAYDPRLHLVWLLPLTRPHVIEEKDAEAWQVCHHPGFDDA